MGIYLRKTELEFLQKPTCKFTQKSPKLETIQSSNWSTGGQHSTVYK